MNIVSSFESDNFSPDKGIPSLLKINLTFYSKLFDLVQLYLTLIQYKDCSFILDYKNDALFLYYFISTGYLAVAVFTIHSLVTRLIVFAWRETARAQKLLKN